MKVVKFDKKGKCEGYSLRPNNYVLQEDEEALGDDITFSSLDALDKTAGKRHRKLAKIRARRDKHLGKVRNYIFGLSKGVLKDAEMLAYAEALLDITEQFKNADKSIKDISLKKLNFPTDPYGEEDSIDL